MMVSMPVDEIVDLINDIFGEKIARYDSDGDIKLYYDGVVNGRKVHMNDHILCQDEIYLYVWYYIRNDKPQDKIEFRKYSPDPTPERSCINDGGLKIDIVNQYDDDEDYYWEFDKESLVNTVAALRDFLKPSLSTIEFEEDLVV